MHRINLSPQRIGTLFCWLIPAIVIVGAFANYGIYNLAPAPDHPIADVLKRFDLGHEPSIPAFYSSSVMLLTALFLLFVGQVDKQRKKPYRFWYFLSVLFIAIAIDEAALFHEMIDAAMGKLSINTGLYFSWIIPGSLFAAAVGLGSLRFLLTLPRRTSVWLIASGVVFVAGAVGMEALAGIIFSNSVSEEEAMRSVAHVVVQAIEEGLEMVGIAMFLTGLVDYVQHSGIVVFWEQQAHD